MSLFEAVVLGVVQGVAEFLPVSSSGHLQIAKEVLGVTLSDNLTFDVMLHVATVLATLVVLWREVAGLFAGLWSGATRWRRNPDTDYVAKLVLSAVPVAVAGLVFRERLNSMLASPAILFIVGSMLLVTAALLVFAGRVRKVAGPTVDPATQKNAGETYRVGTISWRDALIMGVAQAAAAMPGLSRSGTTIAAGLMLGNSRAAVAQFSFLMVIVPILGEALLDIVRSSGPGGGFEWSYLAGFAAAFVVGCVACRFMIEMVKRARLGWFAAWCAVVGLASIVYYFV